MVFSMNIDVNKILIYLDIAFDYIPVVSSISNLIEIFLKATVVPKNKIAARDHYYTHLQEKHYKRCLVLLIPVIGNIKVALNDYRDYNFQRGKENYNHLSKAFSHFKVAALFGHSEAQYQVGLAYEYGYGCAENPKEAVRYYTKAANHGNVKAQLELWNIFKYGQLGVKKNNELSNKYLNLAKKDKDFSSALITTNVRDNDLCNLRKRCL
jgi:TPR repeat protein